MSNIITVDLRGRVPGGRSIEFLRAEMNGSMRTPFALIRYALNGKEVAEGFRIDLDKQTIFDRLGDPETDAVIERAAPLIANLLAPAAIERDRKLEGAVLEGAVSLTQEIKSELEALRDHLATILGRDTRNFDPREIEQAVGQIPASQRGGAINELKEMMKLMTRLERSVTSAEENLKRLDEVAH
jgi:hypothetical protein